MLDHALHLFVSANLAPVLVELVLQVPDFLIGLVHVATVLPVLALVVFEEALDLVLLLAESELTVLQLCFHQVHLLLKAIALRKHFLGRSLLGDGYLARALLLDPHDLVAALLADLLDRSLHRFLQLLQLLLDHFIFLR